MAAFALQEIVQTRFYIRLDSGAAEKEIDHSLLLDAARLRTDSSTAVIYTFQPETFELEAIAARSSVAPRMKDVGATLSAATSQWFEALAGTVQARPTDEPNFEKLPEVLQYALKRLLIVPLRAENLLGLLTLGRSSDIRFEQPEIELAERAGRLLSAVLERDSLQQKLAERKLVERAKGILQQRRKLSEEQAYLMLRNNSRRRRMPMVNLAKEIIELYVQSNSSPRWQAV